MRASKLKINGTYTDEWMIKPKGRIQVPTPEQEVQYIEVKGRHGSLTKKEGYKDIILPVHFTIHGFNFKKIFRRRKMYLLYAKTLVFDDDDEVYYRVKSVRIDTAENLIHEFGEFTVNFTLDPFQYETEDATQSITSNTTIYNLGYESQPIITAEVSGSGAFYINDQEIVIQDINGSIIIDSELMNAYRDDNGILTNLNNHMIGDFPVLEHGSNEMRFHGDISSLEINPRFRWI